MYLVDSFGYSLQIHVDVPSPPRVCDCDCDEQSERESGGYKLQIYIINKKAPFLRFATQHTDNFPCPFDWKIEGKLMIIENWNRSGKGQQTFGKNNKKLIDCYCNQPASQLAGWLADWIQNLASARSFSRFAYRLFIFCFRISLLPTKTTKFSTDQPTSMQAGRGTRVAWYGSNGGTLLRRANVPLCRPRETTDICGSDNQQKKASTEFGH